MDILLGLWLISTFLLELDLSSWSRPFFNSQMSNGLGPKKGASSWLTALPIEEFGFALHKSAFRDALTFRYERQPVNTPSTCACGNEFTLEHVLSCLKGGYLSIWHNKVCDLTAQLMSEVCHNVCIEPDLQPVTGKSLSGASTLTQDSARLDVAANDFWGGRFEKTYFNVRVWKHQETWLWSKSQRDWVRFLYPKCFIINWWSQQCCYHMLQEAGVTSLNQVWSTLQHNHKLAEVSAFLFSTPILNHVHWGSNGHAPNGSGDSRIKFNHIYLNSFHLLHIHYRITIILL